MLFLRYSKEFHSARNKKDCNSNKNIACNFTETELQHEGCSKTQLWVEQFWIIMLNIFSQKKTLCFQHKISGKVMHTKTNLQLSAAGLSMYDLSADFVLKPKSFFLWKAAQHDDPEGSQTQNTFLVNHLICETQLEHQ